MIIILTIFRVVITVEMIIIKTNTGHLSRSSTWKHRMLSGKTALMYYQCWLEVTKQQRYWDKWLTDETYFQAWPKGQEAMNRRGPDFCYSRMEVA
jgi:hypothetical protein